MILTFSETEFKGLIEQGIKIHTVRRDRKGRWKVGMKIHFWLGNPRNTRGKIKPHQFGEGEVSRVEKIRMDFQKDETDNLDTVWIGDDICLRKIDELNALAVNDGFENWAQMRLWFDNPDGQYFGKLIFWKNFKTIEL
ncbi:MAG: hypothetical protein QM642_01920 [Edaphocola sp.]